MSVPSSSFFQRVILPGFAFKAVIIGGGYATGRELVQFFLHCGPVGGLLGLLVTCLVWSAVCAVTFVFARETRSFEYRRFFEQLLGPFWRVFDLAYVLLMLLILSVLGAAAGEIVSAVLGWPYWVGMSCLAAGITGFATFGNSSVERLFKYISIFLYGTYAVFFVLAFSRFGTRIEDHIAISPAPQEWLSSGVTYAAYNLIGAVVILPVARHFTSRRDAVVAGLLSGPLAMLPGVLFFLAIIGFYPQIGDATLPSDYLLSRIGSPLFHLVFQTMVLGALLESGTGLVHALNERIARGLPSIRGRFLTSAGSLIFAMFVSAKVGLITLIAKGYGLSAYVFLVIYVIPLLSLGLLRLRGLRQVAVAELPP